MSAAEEAAFRPIGDWSRVSPDYRGALVMPFDREGRALLQLRDLHAPVRPGEWGMFGGGVEGEETLREAALREFEEETGLRLRPEALHPYIRIVSPTSRRRLFLYVSAFEGSADRIRLGEGAGFAFLPPAEALRFGLEPATRLALSTWLAAPLPLF